MKCDKIDSDVTLPITHRNSELPVCCDQRMNYHITSPPSVIWTDPQIEAFRPVATKNAPVITSMRQHREYMARNDLIDANDLPPLEKAVELKEAKKVQETIDAITPDARQAEQLQAMGLDSPD